MTCISHGPGPWPPTIQQSVCGYQGRHGKPKFVDKDGTTLEAGNGGEEDECLADLKVARLLGIFWLVAHEQVSHSRCQLHRCVVDVHHMQGLAVLGAAGWGAKWWDLRVSIMHTQHTLECMMKKGGQRIWWDEDAQDATDADDDMEHNDDIRDFGNNENDEDNVVNRVMSECRDAGNDPLCCRGSFVGSVSYVFCCASQGAYCVVPMSR